MALAEAEIDQVDAPGGAAKTVSVSGQVLTSLRPKSRPTAAEVPEVVDIAMAEGIEGALAEATAIPAPDGTLQAQAEDLALVEGAVIEGTGETVEAAEIDTDAAVALALAEAPPEGTLEAQALALADGSAAAPAEENTLDAQANVLSEAFAAVVPDVRPKARPESLQPEIQQAEIQQAGAEIAAPATEDVQVAEVVAEQPVVTETVAMADADQPIEQPMETASAVAPVDLADVTAVETVAGATNSAPMTLAQIAPVKRKAPIYDTVAVAPKAEDPQEAEVVVRVSTSGGRHFGVNVGKFGSRGEAEKALFKLALAESATLNQGLRKVTERNGAYRANFMGLTEEQAELACRRLRARAVDCETVGS
jgi:D-alanyl-D-alanine carboxypeptidase